MDSFLVFALELVPGTKGFKAGLGDTQPGASLPDLLSLRCSVNTLQSQEMPVASAAIFKK